MGDMERYSLAVVFPAYAGVNLTAGVVYRLNMRIPRVCGGEPQGLPLL